MNFLAALMGPFFLLLIEGFLPYSFFLEEVYKFFLAKSSKSTKTGILLGLLFSTSEAIFYLFNPSYQLLPLRYIQRFFVVTLMHITTILVMQYAITKNNKILSFVGLLIAIFIHWAFNTLNML